MPFVWLVECKTCLQSFAALPREVAPKAHYAAEAEQDLAPKPRTKSTSALSPGAQAGTFECPHCHEVHAYTTEDLIPGEGRIIHA